jgi:hypothetical protein
MNIESHKFSSTATSEKPDILQGRTPEQFLKSKYTRGMIFGLDHLQKEGCYLLAGWCFNFRPFMKLYLVRQHGNWSEMWAMNKTAIRNSTYGTIEGIVEWGKCKQ